MGLVKKIGYGPVIFFLLLSISSAWAQPDHTAKLIEGAKKENRLLWYTALTLAPAC